MQLLERIEEQISATRLPLVAVTVAAVSYANTPHCDDPALAWSRADLAGRDRRRQGHTLPFRAELGAANQRTLERSGISRPHCDGDRVGTGAWDMARIERASCLRPGADGYESLECLRAFAIVLTRSTVSRQFWPKRRTPTAGEAAVPLSQRGQSAR